MLKPQGVYDPLSPALLLPDVTDDAKWLNGFAAGFLDNERQFVYAFAGYVVPVVSVNRDFVPESELNRMEQLLDPRWRGKISWEDPRSTGVGSADAGHLLMVLGEEFLSRLLQQDLLVLSDRRQQVEALVRGTYPLGGGIDPVGLVPYHQQGLGQNVGLLDRNSEAGTRLTVDSGSVMLINKAPHPNAANVYINWLLSQEGQRAWAQATAANSRRLDVDGPRASAPDPQRTYRIINSEQYNSYITRAQAMAQEFLK